MGPWTGQLVHRSMDQLGPSAPANRVVLAACRGCLVPVGRGTGRANDNGAVQMGSLPTTS